MPLQTRLIAVDAAWVALLKLRSGAFLTAHHLQPCVGDEAEYFLRVSGEETEAAHFR